MPDGNCFYCGVEFAPPGVHSRTSRSRDHLTPRSRGGPSHGPNIVLACVGCNGDKGNLTLEEYRAVISLRFSTPARFWGEGHPQLPAPATKAVLIRERRAARPIPQDDPNPTRQLPAPRPPLDLGSLPVCPRRDMVATSASPLTGLTFGTGLVVVGVISGVRGSGRARFVCRCPCGRFVARTSKAIRNPLNTEDACDQCSAARRAAWKSTHLNQVPDAGSKSVQ